jgi:hypothetical protein
MSEICKSSLNPSTKQVACAKIPNMPAALLFCKKGEKYEIVGDSIGADVVTNAPIVLTGIKTTVPVDTAATSQTLGDFTLTNDDEYTGLTFGFVKTPCNVKSIQNVANSGKGGLLILTKNGVLIGKKIHFDGTNYSIEPLDINSMSAAFPTGILADGSDLAATLTINFGMVTKLINSAKVACIDVADEYPQITGYELTTGGSTATTVSFIATDCAGAEAEASKLTASEVYVNGTASTAVASAVVGGHTVWTATLAANVIVAGVNTLVLESTSKYGKTTFKFTA